MSRILEPTTPASSASDGANGLIIQGLDDQANRLNGSEETDMITGGSLDDFIDSFLGCDSVFGLGGNDFILAGPCDDFVDGGDDDDEIFGEADNDTLLGGGGSDTLSGGDGEDFAVIVAAFLIK